MLTSKSHVKRQEKFKSQFFYTLDISMVLNLLDKLKKVFPYKVTVGNSSIWLGAILSYIVMEGNGGKLFSTIINTVDVAFLLELAILPFCY